MDATLKTIRLLDDRRKFRVVRNVPVFIPHRREIFDPITKKKIIVEVKNSDLPDIERNWRKFEAGGNLVRLTDGHVKKGERPPELMGYARKPRVGRWGPKGKPGILADFYVPVAKYGQLAKEGRPFRSVEYLPSRKQIRGVALLTADPFLDMGVVHYSADGPIVYMGDTMDMPAQPDQGLGDFSPEEVQLFERLMKYMDMKNAQTAAPPMPDQGSGDMDMGSGMSGQPTQPGAPPAPAPAPDDDETQYEFAAPSGGNTFTPGADNDDFDDEDFDDSIFDETPAKPVSKPAAKPAPAKVDYERELKRERIGRQLDKLEAAGYTLDVERETNMLLNYSDDEIQGHIDYIKQTYRRKPNGGGLIDTVMTQQRDRAASGGKKPLTQADRDKILNYQARQIEKNPHFTFEDAAEALNYEL